MPRYWLFKSEPSVFGIEDLARRLDRTEPWDGVRNFQVRNFLRDDMKPGDLGFFYHSSCPEPGVAGTVRVVSPGYPDPTAWDPKSDHYDPRTSPDAPLWYQVDVCLVEIFPRFVPLARLRTEPALSGLLILRRGSRLSITPVAPEEWVVISALGHA